jgi:DNA-directed RNA polymerase subunit RPC12/RpoP
VTKETLSCSKHGEQSIALVSAHIAEAADTGNRVGFFWSREDDQKFPDAWCGTCNSKLINLDAWTKEMFDHASFKVICSECYKELRTQQTDEQAL